MKSTLDLLLKRVFKKYSAKDCSLFLACMIISIGSINWILLSMAGSENSGSLYNSLISILVLIAIYFLFITYYLSRMRPILGISKKKYKKVYLKRVSVGILILAVPMAFMTLLAINIYTITNPLYIYSTIFTCITLQGFLFLIEIEKMKKKKQIT